MMWFGGGAPSVTMNNNDGEPRKKQPWILLTVILVVGAIVASVISNEKIGRFDEDAIVTHEYMESPLTSDLKSMRVDKSVDLKDLDLVSQNVGEKESEMEGSVILSDGAESEKHQIEMDRASLNEASWDDQVRLMHEKEVAEEVDGKHMASTSRHVMDKQDMHLELISEEELPLTHLKAKSNAYNLHGCRRFRRCYKKFCDMPRCAQVDGHQRECKKYHRCKGVGILKRCKTGIRCTPRPYKFELCDRRPVQCGKICRVLTLCDNNADRLAKFNFLCYNRYCARRYCARQCTEDVQVCKRYRRCYRRCVGECGKKDTKCVHRCYNYKKCHRLNKCYNRCFMKREVCGNRCVHKTTSSSEDLTHYGAEPKSKRYGETSGRKKKAHSSSSDAKKKSSEKKNGKKHSSKSAEKKNTKEPEHPHEHPEETHSPAITQQHS